MRALFWCFMFLLVAGIFLGFVLPMLRVAVISGTIFPHIQSVVLNSTNQSVAVISLNYSYIYNTGLNLRFNATNLTVDLHKKSVPILVENPKGKRFYDLIWDLLGYDAWQIRPSQYFMIVNLSRFVGLKPYDAHREVVRYGRFTQKKDETIYLLQPVPVDQKDVEGYYKTVVLVNFTTLKPCECKMTYPPSANVTYTYKRSDVGTYSVTADAFVFLHGEDSCDMLADIYWYLVINGYYKLYGITKDVYADGVYTNVYWNGYGPLCRVRIRKEYYSNGNETWCEYYVYVKARHLNFKICDFDYDFTFTIFNGSDVQRKIPIYVAVNSTVVWAKKTAWNHSSSHVTSVNPPKVQKFKFSETITEKVVAWEDFEVNYSFYVWDNPYVPSYGKHRLRKFWIGNITVHYHPDDTSLPRWGASKTYRPVADITPHLRQAPPWVYHWTKPVHPHVYGIVNVSEDYAKDYLLYVTALCLNKSLYKFAERTLAKHGLSSYVPFEVYWLIQQIPMDIPLNVSVRVHPIEALYNPKDGYLSPNLIAYYLLAPAIPLNATLFDQNHDVCEIYYKGSYYHGRYMPNNGAGLVRHNISAVVLAYLTSSEIPSIWNDTVYHGHIFTNPKGQLFIVDASYQKSPCAEWITVNKNGSVVLMFPSLPRAGSSVVLTKGWKPIPTFASFKSKTFRVTVAKYYVSNWKSYVGAKNYTKYESYLH